MQFKRQTNDLPNLNCMLLLTDEYMISCRLFRNHKCNLYWTWNDHSGQFAEYLCGRILL